MPGQQGGRAAGVWRRRAHAQTHKHAVSVWMCVCGSWARTHPMCWRGSGGAWTVIIARGDGELRAARPAAAATRRIPGSWQNCADKRRKLLPICACRELLGS